MQPPDVFRDLAQIPERATAGSCFGAPTTAGERTVIPVAEVLYGLGVGWGGGVAKREEAEDSGGGGGGGGGSRIRGVAVIEVAPDGVRVHPVRDETSIVLAGIALASASSAIVARTLLKLIRG